MGFGSISPQGFPTPPPEVLDAKLIGRVREHVDRQVDGTKVMEGRDLPFTFDLNLQEILSTDAGPLEESGESEESDEENSEEEYYEDEEEVEEGDPTPVDKQIALALPVVSSKTERRKAPLKRAGQKKGLKKGSKTGTKIAPKVKAPGPDPDADKTAGAGGDQLNKGGGGGGENG